MKGRSVLALVALVGAGLGLRTLPQKALSAWWPWKTTMVTLYFPNGHSIVPVSRRLTRDADVPRAALQALLAGPSKESGVQSPIPPGVEIRSFELEEGVARIDLSSAFRSEASRTRAAEMAIVETMTALPGLTTVALSVDGRSVVDAATHVPLLYYGSANGLVAVPISATTPRAALTTYLLGPPDSDLTGLPPDVRLLGYEHNPIEGLLRVNFSYTRLVRTFALEQPERMRLLLLGLIASLTEFPSVRAVRLDFEGQTRLGLGQCSDLLRTPQPRPELLNDERLLGR